MSSAASSRTTSKTATAPLEAAAQMSPRTVLLRRWRSRKADGLRNTSDRTAPAYDGLGDADYVTITGMAKTWSEKHRRRTVHDRSAGAARVYLGRPSRLHRKGRNTTGDSSRLLLDRRPGRDLRGHDLTEGHGAVGSSGRGTEPSVQGTPHAGAAPAAAIRRTALSAVDECQDGIGMAGHRSLSDHLQPAYRKSSKEIREAVSDRGRVFVAGVRGRP
jgi:hypothetical protein